MNAPDEPLKLSVPIAWQLAHEHCNRNASTGESCLWNHGLWQLLRLLGLAGSASNRGEFYRSAIRDCTRGNPAPRILISGTTDYAMLAQVIAAFAGSGSTPKITVIDICDTPLLLNQWYADRLSCSLLTVRTDILEYEPADRFDLVCSDSFISRFPHAQWPQLASRWHDLLRPGGTLLTSSKVRPDSGPEPLVFSAEEVVVFRNAVLEKSLQHGFQSMIGVEDIAVAAEQYAKHQSNHPLQSAGQLKTLLESADMAVDSLNVNDQKSTHGIRAPTVNSSGKYLYVIAHRP